MDLGLTGRVAMVAGASRGLGYAVARALAAEGAQVSILSRDEAAVRRAAGRIEAETRGAAVLALAGDVAAAETVERWHAATMEHFGGVDLLFTNSGGPPAGPLLGFDDAAWQRAFELLVLSTIRLARACAPDMARRGKGSILVSTSSSVKEPIPNLGLSSVLRASVASFAKSLALELAPQNIRVNQLVPGRIDTDRVRELDEGNAKRLGTSAEEQKLRATSAIPLARYGDPDEFGRAAAFLLSDAAGYVTGATLQVDGGMIRSVF
jgi:3-oxoacyl-[acyl-carrier protein] reductase